MLHKIDTCTRIMSMVTKENWAIVCQDVKNQCIYVVKGLILELDKRFPTQELMNATSIVYS
jgi:hypothetical protein